MSHRVLVPLLALVACVASVERIIAGADADQKAVYRRAELDAPQPGAPFRIEQLDGTVLDSRDLDGRIVVIDIWATWCGPCLTEIPRLNDLQREYAEHGVEVISVAVGSGTVSDVRRVATDHFPVDYTLAVGNAEFERAFGPLWALPRTILIDRDWQVRKTWTGALPGKGAELRALIDRLIGPAP